MTEDKAQQQLGVVSDLNNELDTTSDKPKEQYTLRGFGTTFDCATGMSRNWYCTGGVKRWEDNDQPCCA